MSSPNTTPRRTSKKSSPKRTPLQERTPSQKNEAAGRLHIDSKQDLRSTNIFTTTPFPTKPQHVLLPSTVRKQRSRHNVENELPALFSSSQPNLADSGSSSTSQFRHDDRRVRRAPNLHLKKSVTALRDMYEAQAESSRPSTAQHSRPSTAAPSPALRPMTASSRVRSISSSDGFGRGAWEMLGLPKVSGDDLSALPALAETVGLQLDSDQSFASRMRNQPGTSSPNFRTFGSSSPGLPTFHEDVVSSDPQEESSSSQLEMTGMSSNFIQLHHSSSVMTTDPTPPLEEEEEEGESSPNLIKLGTTSPRRSSSPTPSVASVVSRKRKRTDVEGSAYAGRTPLFFGARRTLSESSPPIRNIPASSDVSVRSSETRVLPSSPPEIDSAQSQEQGSSSPIFRVHGGDRSSIASAHTNLQSILSSSPGPPIHRPIIRAPDIHQFEKLAAQKRAASGQTAETSNTARLSPVPSVSNIEVQQLSSTDLTQFQPKRNSSRLSAFTEDLDDALDDESIAPVQAYIVRHDLNSSQVQMISETDRHEATDELRALPREHTSFAAALSQARSASFLGSNSSSNSLSRLESMRTSMDSRFQSMRSFAHARNDSFRSSLRPGSSGSHMSQTVVPTWARQYYSGLYRNSFQYLYQSQTNLAYTVTQVPPPPPMPISRPASFPASSSFDTYSSRSKSDLARSLSRSVRSSLKSIRIPKMGLGSGRPRLNVRDSHMTAGIGPLVSHPVRSQSEFLSRPPSIYNNRQTLRRVSAPLSAIDPRYHWNGIIEEPETVEGADQVRDSESIGTPRFAEAVPIHAAQRPIRGYYAAPWRFLRTSTPHLHQDRRLHTGSSESQGFGAPYNSHSRWQPPSGRIDNVKSGQSSWFKPDLRDAQIICFIAGFVCPLTWFVGAFLRLPQRPSRFMDLEKAAVATGTHNSAMFSDNPNEWDADGDVIARLRLEKHLKGLEEVRWQNARWWKRANKSMSIVGFVVLVIVIALAIIGTRSWS